MQISLFNDTEYSNLFRESNLFYYKLDNWFDFLYYFEYNTTINGLHFLNAKAGKVRCAINIHNELDFNRERSWAITGLTEIDIRSSIFQLQLLNIEGACSNEAGQEEHFLK